MKVSNYRSELGRLLVSASVSAIVLGSMASSARAADATPQLAAADANSGQIEEIVVTARKRSEKLLDVPIAITALSEKNIEEQGISSLRDVAAATPGLTVDGTIGGSGRNDRSFPEYIIRGMTPSSTTNPTVTVFLNGAAIPSGQIEAVDDVQSVQVLKGPQSANFGRETFAGAINIVTKDPSDTLSGAISGLVGSRNYTDFRGTLEGPIVADKVLFRLSLRDYAKDGSYVNAAAPASKASNDETLGDQSTRSASLEFLVKPIDDLRIRVMGMYWTDNDGPSAQGLITTSQSNCSFGTVKYYCGVTPGLTGATPAANTIVDGPIQAMLHNSLGKEAYILFNPSDLVDHYGLGRDAYHLSLGLDYDLAAIGASIHSTTALDKQRFSELQDLDNADTFAIPSGGGYQSFYNFPFIIEQRYKSLSQDLNVQSDSTNAFRWKVGASYDWVRADQALIASDVASYKSGSTGAETLGAYFGLDYDILPALTLTFEGRYQTDKQTAYNGDTNISSFGATYRDFLPRVSLSYKVTPDVMTYVTYSQGVNPGAFNTGLQSLTAAQQAAAVAQLGATTEVKPEHLENYEAGIKGKFLDGKATVSADVYYDKWTDQIFLGQFTVFNIIGGVSTPNLQTVDNNSNASTIKGIEFDGTFVPVQHVTLNASGAINDTKITKGSCGTCFLIDGSTNMIGKQLPNVSKYQASIGLQYADQITSMADWNWFARADYTYKSGAYDLPANLVKTPDTNTLNFRVGADSGQLRVEGFVTNVTNDGAFTNIAPTASLVPPSDFSTPNTLVVGLPPLRTYGIRVKYYFGG